MAVVQWLVVWTMLLHTATFAGANGPPRVSGRPQSRHLAKKGKNTKLVCPVEADPTPFTEWKKDNEKIQTGWTRFKVTQEGELRIREVQMSDAGIYICRATNGFGTVSINYTVVVLDEGNKLVQEQDSTYPQSPNEDLTKDGMAPEFRDAEKMQEDSTQTRPAGSTVRLKCRAKGNPEPHVTWFKDDLPFSAEEDARRRPHTILKLPRVKESDSGSYMCMVSNRLGNLNFTYKLVVIDQVRTKPKLISSHPQNTTVEQGSTASFQCRVKSLVQPHIKWVKRLEEWEMNQPLNTTIEVIPGHKFKILRTSGEVYSSPDGSYLNKLVIHHATERDSGMYVCLGANSNGFSFKSAYLTVVPAAVASDDGAASPSASSKLPLYVGVPAGGVLVLVILAVFLLQNRNRCGHSRRQLKRHRLPVPTLEPRADSAAAAGGPALPPSAAAAPAGFYNSYHPSPTTTTNTGGGTATTANTVTSGLTVHGGGSGHVAGGGGHLYSSLSAAGKVPKTPAPSIDFGSDISSVSHSQSHPQAAGYPYPGHSNPQHFPHMSYGY